MDPRGILVIGEIADGQLSSTGAELLAAGRGIASGLGEELAIGLLGSDLDGPAKEAISFGADKVYTASHTLLGEYQVDIYLAAAERLCREVSPQVILLGRTDIGRDVAPRLAFRLGVGLAQDCSEVRINEESRRLQADRPVYGGNAMATVECLGTPQIAAIRPKSYEPLEADHARQGDIVPVVVDLDPSMAKIRVVEVVKEESEGVKLQDARIVVAGGRGLGGPEPFKDLEELANVIGAGIGASRAAVDSGWVPPHWQIGLTGKTITPDLYITVGISGASQHMAGCSGAKVMVSINKDREANIFKESSYGVVGDWQKVLPAFTEAVRDALPF